MKFNCEIKGLDNLTKKISNIVRELPKKVNESVEEILINIQGYAIRLEKGHNSNGILVEMIETSSMNVKGRVYADPNKFYSKDTNGKETCYLLFEYFGTGAMAEMEHVGESTHFKETGYTEWYIPVKNVQRDLNYPIKVMAGKEFYVATGAKPNHFLSDTEFKKREENKEIIKKKIQKMFEEVCK